MGNQIRVQCYHCKSVLTKLSDIYITVAGEEKIVCCYGCQAVATALQAVNCYPPEAETAMETEVL